MNKAKWTAALLGLCLLILSAQGGQRRRHKMKHPAKQTSARIANGGWGGPHARLQVTDNGAEIEFDCAHGTLAGPLTLDAQGHFSVAGTFAGERGGPVRIDEKDTSVPARYTGSAHGDTMSLNVKINDGQEDVGTFTLTKGSSGRLWKCR